MSLITLSNAKFKLSGSLCKLSELLFLFFILPTCAATRSEAIKACSDVLSSCCLDSVQTLILRVEVLECLRTLLALRGTLRKSINETERLSAFILHLTDDHESLLSTYHLALMLQNVS